MIMKVYVLAISHPYGTHISASSTYELAFKDLFEYVNDYLEDQRFQSDFPELIDANEEERVKFYFETYADEESYIIKLCEVIE